MLRVVLGYKDLYIETYWERATLWIFKMNLLEFNGKPNCDQLKSLIATKCNLICLFLSCLKNFVAVHGLRRTQELQRPMAFSPPLDEASGWWDQEAKKVFISKAALDFVESQRHGLPLIDSRDKVGPERMGLVLNGKFKDPTEGGRCRKMTSQGPDNRTGTSSVKTNLSRCKRPKSAVHRFLHFEKTWGLLMLLLTTTKARCRRIGKS